MDNTRSVVGIVLILLGALFLAGQFGLDINIGAIWPIVLLLPGVIFWISYFANRENRDSYVLLIPGTILVVYSLYFFFNEATGYDYAGETSFMFTLGVGLSFFAAYYLSKSKPRGLLIAAWIVSAMALINLVSTISTWNWWPVIFIAVGITLLYKRSQRLEKKESNDNHSSENEKKS